MVLHDMSIFHCYSDITWFFLLYNIKIHRLAALSPSLSTLKAIISIPPRVTVGGNQKLFSSTLMPFHITAISYHGKSPNLCGNFRITLFFKRMQNTSILWFRDVVMMLKDFIASLSSAQMFLRSMCIGSMRAYSVPTSALTCAGIPPIF